MFLRPVTNSHSPDHLQAPTFEIISFFEVGHLTLENIYEYNTESYLRHYMFLNEILLFLLMVFFPALIFFLFLLKCSTTQLVFSLTNYIMKQKRCIEKDKNSKDVYLFKVSNKEITGIIESS